MSQRTIQDYVWMIEVFIGGWYPTRWCYMVREEARERLKVEQTIGSGSRFRIKEYRRKI